MKLYYTPGTCSLAPHIALREADLPCSLVRVDLETHRTEQGEDFYQLNPTGYVPLLELDDGERLTECPALLQYIADQVPDLGLAPLPGTLPRYRLQQWLNFISAELHKGFGALYNPRLREAAGEILRELLDQRLEVAAAQLKGRPFLLGDQFTVADAYLFTVLSWAPLLEYDLGPWPVFAQYQQHIATRPGVQKALRAEGLLDDAGG